MCEDSLSRARRGWSLSSFESIAAPPTGHQDHVKLAAHDSEVVHPPAQQSPRLFDDNFSERESADGLSQQPWERSWRGMESKTEAMVHTDLRMWKNYAYWVQELAPQWELTMKHSQKKKQAFALVASEGMPALARGALWPLCIGDKLHLNRELYAILKTKARSATASCTSRGSEEHMHASQASNSFGRESTAQLIANDLNRTMAQLALFDAAGPYKLQLRDVLEAYCFYRPDIGYVQGMSFQAAMFVIHCNDDFTAFSCLANVISRPFFQCFFRNNDDFKAECLAERLQIFDDIFCSKLPALHRHLGSQGVRLEMYARTWFMTLFAKQLPLSLAARIWDLYFIQGEVVLYKTALAILRMLLPQLLKMEEEDLLMLLLGSLEKAIPCDHQKVLEAIEATRLTPSATSALDKLFAREAVHEFKHSQHSL